MGERDGRGGGISTFKGRRKNKGGEGGGGINGRRRDGEETTSAILKEVNTKTQQHTRCST